MYSTLRGFDKIKPILKKELAINRAMNTCKQCGEAAAGDLCKACTFTDKWK